MSLNHIIDDSKFRPKIDANFKTLKINDSRLIVNYPVSWAGDLDNSTLDRYPRLHATSNDVAPGTLTQSSIFIVPYLGYITAITLQKESNTRAVTFDINGSLTPNLLTFVMLEGTTRQVITDITWRVVQQGEQIYLRCIGDVGTGLPGEVNATIYISPINEQIG